MRFENHCILFLCRFQKLELYICISMNKKQASAAYITWFTTARGTVIVSCFLHIVESLLSQSSSVVWQTCTQIKGPAGHKEAFYCAYCSKLYPMLYRIHYTSRKSVQSAAHYYIYSVYQYVHVLRINILLTTLLSSLPCTLCSMLHPSHN